MNLYKYIVQAFQLLGILYLFLRVFYFYTFYLIPFTNLKNLSNERGVFMFLLDAILDGFAWIGSKIGERLLETLLITLILVGLAMVFKVTIINFISEQLFEVTNSLSQI
jgi:hypothetical protein